jgi:hypothetical protein
VIFSSWAKLREKATQSNAAIRPRIVAGLIIFPPFGKKIYVVAITGLVIKI